MSNDTKIDFAPDLALCAGFLAHFGPSEAPHCFQTFDDSPRKDARLARTLHGNLSGVWKQLVALNDRGAGVFVTIGEVLAGQPRTAPNVLRARAYVADNDNPARGLAVEAEIAHRGPTPSMIVESSPGKRHYYWPTNDCPLAGFKPIQQAIAAALGTDPSVCDLPRVMRLPGFVHCKAAPFLVREIGKSSRLIHTYAAIMAAYPPGAVRQTPASRTRGTSPSAKLGAPAVRLRALFDRFGGLVTPAVQAAIVEAQHGTRHSLMLAIVARLVPMCWPDADICALVLPAATAAWPDVDPRELGERLDRLLSWVRAQEACKRASAPPLSARAARLASSLGGGRRASA